MRYVHHADQVDDIDPLVSRRVQGILETEWGLNHNLLFHGTGESRLKQILRQGLRSQADYLLRGGRYVHTNRRGSAGISFTLNSREALSFMGKGDASLGGVLVFPMNEVFSESTMIQVPRVRDTFEVILTTENTRGDRSIEKDVTDILDRDNAVYEETEHSFIPRYEAILEDLESLQSAFLESNPSLSSDQTVDFYEELSRALSEPLGSLLLQPPPAIEAARQAHLAVHRGEASDEDQARKAASEDLTQEDRILVGDQYEPTTYAGLLTALKDVLHVDSLAGHLDESLGDLIEKAREALADGDVDEALTLCQAYVVSHDGLDVERLTVDGAHNLLVRSFEVFEDLAAQRLSDHTVSVPVQDALLVTVETVEDAVLAAADEKKIPTLVLPSRFFDDGWDRDAIEAAFISFLEHTGVSYSFWEEEPRLFTQRNGYTKFYPTEWDGDTATDYESYEY